jgi:hypothetical protein
MFSEDRFMGIKTPYSPAHASAPIQIFDIRDSGVLGGCVLLSYYMLTPVKTRYSTCMDCSGVCPSHSASTQDFSILFRFSLRFTRSTRLLCIFSSIAAYRTRSSLAVRLVRIFSIRTCSLVSLQEVLNAHPSHHTYLSSCFLLILHFLLLCLHGRLSLPLLCALLE